MSLDLKSSKYPIRTLVTNHPCYGSRPRITCERAEDTNRQPTTVPARSSGACAC